MTKICCCCCRCCRCCTLLMLQQPMQFISKVASVYVIRRMDMDIIWKVPVFYYQKQLFFSLLLFLFRMDRSFFVFVHCIPFDSIEKATVCLAFVQYEYAQVWKYSNITKFNINMTCIDKYIENQDTYTFNMWNDSKICWISNDKWCVPFSCLVYSSKSFAILYHSIVNSLLYLK